MPFYVPLRGNILGVDIREEQIKIFYKSTKPGVKMKKPIAGLCEPMAL